MIDAHLHGIEAVPANYSDYGDLKGMVSCVAKADEWDRQLSNGDPRMIKSYGIHPWYAEEWTPENRERLFDILAGDPAAQIGEIGLDGKRGRIQAQTAAFEEQLDMAEQFNRVVSVHDIGCEKIVLESLRGRTLRAVILHSYGSDSYLKPFSELECYFSVSPRLLSRSDIRVRRLVDAIPEDRLLLETDSPNCGRDFSGMRDFAERLGSIAGRPADSLLSLAEQNFGRIFI